MDGIDPLLLYSDFPNSHGGIAINSVDNKLYFTNESNGSIVSCKLPLGGRRIGGSRAEWNFRNACIDVASELWAVKKRSRDVGSAVWRQADIR